MLSMIIDRYAVTHEEALRASARSVFDGIRRCATVHKVPGFIARGVCPEDRSGIYVTSSRDQYTHCVHGLWQYFHSPLCDEGTRAEIAGILGAIADRMTRNVTPENNYDFLRADGKSDPRGICRMLDVEAHEAARLPMFYAAAWDAGRNEEHHRLYRKYVSSAIRQSFDLNPKTMTYALLQMQCSLELLDELETDPALREQMREVMRLVAREAERRAINAGKNAGQLDLTMAGPDWRKSGGLGGDYRKVWYCIRESGESALTQLIAKGHEFPEGQRRLLADAIIRLDYGRVSSSGIFYLQAAYWKARVRDIFVRP